MLSKSTIKRKEVYVEPGDFSSFISEQIKRCRISCTPGEIRLSKDVKELSCFKGIEVEFVDSASKILLKFVGPKYAPCKFLVSVSRYYPHDSPVVRCLEEGFTNEFILANGEIKHNDIKENWTAIESLRTVAIMLEKIRIGFCADADHDMLCDDTKCSAATMGM